jgi:hypothetical protein
MHELIKFQEQQAQVARYGNTTGCVCRQTKAGKTGPQVNCKAKRTSLASDKQI